jgi:hypothetical protein
VREFKFWSCALFFFDEFKFLSRKLFFFKIAIRAVAGGQINEFDDVKKGEDNFVSLRSGMRGGEMVVIKRLIDS